MKYTEEEERIAAIKSIIDGWIMVDPGHWIRATGEQLQEQAALEMAERQEALRLSFANEKR